MTIYNENIKLVLIDKIQQVFDKQDMGWCVERFLNTTNSVYKEKSMLALVKRLNQAGVKCEIVGFDNNVFNLETDFDKYIGDNHIKRLCIY